MVGSSTIATEPVAVIGASTAGLFVAYQLAQVGVPVRVYDEVEALGGPERTLILTGRVNDALGFAPTRAIVNRTHTIELVSPQRSLAVRLEEPDLIVERATLVRLLAEKATEAGAEIHLGRRFVGLEPADDAALLRFEGAGGAPVEPVRARTLVGADGVSSGVAQALGLGGRSTTFLRQAVVAMPPWAKPDVTQVWFDRDATRYFFWLIPESAERAAVGLIADDEAEACASLEAFLKARKLTPLEYQDALVPVSMNEKPVFCRVGGARAFLVGDAAGQVKMTTVGGVVTGLYGAEAAVRAILGAGSYRRRLLGLRWELDLHMLVRRVLNRFSNADYDALLEMVNGRMEGVLAVRNRDQLARLLFPALVAQPRLLSLTARILLRRDGARPAPRMAEPFSAD